MYVITQECLSPHSDATAENGELQQLCDCSLGSGLISAPFQHHMLVSQTDQRLPVFPIKVANAYSRGLVSHTIMLVCSGTLFLAWGAFRGLGSDLPSYMNFLHFKYWNNCPGKIWEF